MKGCFFIRDDDKNRRFCLPNPFNIKRRIIQHLSQRRCGLEHAHKLIEG